MKPQFTYQKNDIMLHCQGDGWEYYGLIGVGSKFKSTKKVPSIRVIKTLVKELNKV